MERLFYTEYGILHCLRDVRPSAYKIARATALQDGTNGMNVFSRFGRNV
jgi:hypothetical protein